MAPSRAGCLILLTLLAACGGEEERGLLPIIDETIVFPSIVDFANVDHAARQAWYESAWVADQLSAQAPRGMDLPAAPSTAALRMATDLMHLPRHLASPELVFGTECIPTITGYDGAGDLIDSDGDGIPNDYKVDYGDACVAEVDGGVVRLTISGSRRLQDTGFGFRSFKLTTIDLVILVEYIDTGAIHQVELSGYEEGSFAAGGAHYAQLLTVREHSVDPLAGTDEHRYRQIIQAGDFVPLSGLSLALRAPLPAGYLTWHADLGHMDPVDPETAERLFYRFTMNTAVELQYSPTCNGGDFIAGALDGRLNGGEETGFHLSWTGCTEVPAKELFGYLN